MQVFASCLLQVLRSAYRSQWRARDGARPTAVFRAETTAGVVAPATRHALLRNEGPLEALALPLGGRPDIFSTLSGTEPFYVPDTRILLR